MNIIGFDLDGVVLKPPVPFYDIFKEFDFNFLVRTLRKTNAFRKFFYGGIKINNQIKELMEGLKKKGHKIVVISGHSLECEKEVIDCLKKREISFHDLHLCPNGDSHKEFKLEKIRQINCSFYIEDRWDIVNFLRRELGSDCYIIHYHEKRSTIDELKILFNI